MAPGMKKPPASTPGVLQEKATSTMYSASSLAQDRARSQSFAEQLDGIYVVIAEIKTAAGEQRFRRRFYAQLASAQLAVDRARMNGREAYLFIGQIAIVDGDHLPADGPQNGRPAGESVVAEGRRG